MKDTWDWLVDLCIWHEAADPYEVYTDEHGEPKRKKDTEEEGQVQYWEDF